ncbi:MAG: hypothetical protein K2K84_04255, partial [Muribaculaceae bacterium]|nr:hypothetical protein [Muribaculaceae bacterium]
MTRSLRSIFVILALLTVSLPSTANGDPVTRYSSIHRLGNPEPLAIPEIRIIKENLVISHEDGYNC